MIRLTFYLALCVLAVCFTFAVARLTPGELANGNQRTVDKATGYELPLAGHWNLGEAKDGFSPQYQMKLIEQGHHLLPWFLMPNVFAQPSDPRWIEYYETAFKKCAQLRLPISLVGTQWESVLTYRDEYFRLPAEKNPNVVAASGEIRREISPFGPVESWREAGRQWASGPMIKKLQEWYPNPTELLFVSNNEHPRLAWNKAEEDRRYLQQYGPGRSDEFKRRVVADGWVARYRALRQGLREGLSSEAWRRKAIFIGYDAFGPPHFGRWPGWLEYSFYSKGRINPWSQAWDGASPSFYLFNWSAITDFTVYSPQVESMNWVFMLDEARRTNPNYWFELSTWDGHEPELDNDKRKTYARMGQTFTPARYGGMVQFGMWLLRPRVVREFREYRDVLAKAEPYFMPIVAAVDRVHNNQTLKEFWRKGELVPNRTKAHPYQTLVPEEYQRVDRWFLLDTSLDPAQPWELGTQLPVFALSLAQGAAPNRQWLIYAHSPLKDRNNVKITIPGYQAVTVNVTVAGSFYLVDEKSRRVQPVK